MKVFYVMVLALVAGAVPSHGRTESEGTVFNKTQLHESMSNLTVSSSKLVTYGFSYLVMQWPKSFCNYLNTINRQCNQPGPARFTVHGLWPQYNLTHSVDCGRRLPRYPPFNINQPNFRREFLDDLNYYWPDLTTVGDYNHIFWGNEYDKHGSCTFNDQIGYFRLTLALARNFRHLISRLTRIGGINFVYSSDEIKRAVYRVTNKRPRLYCVPDDNRRTLLLEIRFCVGRNGLLTNCSRYRDCRNRMVYLPRPRPLRP